MGVMTTIQGSSSDSIRVVIWTLPSDTDTEFVKLNQDINKYWDGHSVYGNIRFYSEIQACQTE